MQLRIAVIGQSGQVPARTWDLAEEVGRLIAQNNGILLTGGTDGIMEAASRGASKAGGIVVGILPGGDQKLANPYVNVPITTGLAFDQRSSVLIHSADAVIMIAGANGTLGELSLAYQNNKPTVVLEGSGGWADKIRSIAPRWIFDSRKNVRIRFAQSASLAVELAFALIEKVEEKQFSGGWCRDKNKQISQ